MNWLGRLLRRGKVEQQLDKELSFHLDQHARDLIERGYDPAEAQRQARIEIGGPEQVKEECRDARGTRWVDDLVKDFRYALRTLRQRPGFAAVAVLTLALGIGATTVMFSVIDGVVLRPLPYADPARLVLIQEKTDYSTQWGDLWAVANPNYQDVKSQVHSLEMAAWRWGTGTLSTPGDAVNIQSLEVAADFFPMLGITPIRGRSFMKDDDRAGAPPVAIISYALWQRRFGQGLQAAGSTLTYDGKTYSVVGVLPPDFKMLGADPDVFLSLGQSSSPNMQNRARHSLRVWGHLRPGATMQQAQAELAIVGRQLARQYPESNKGRTFIVEALRPDIGDVGSTLWLLLAAVGVVLLIACVNVASLLLARAVSRERELAMRAALGASRNRLIRQCLTESAVLGLVGGLLGVLLASAGIRASSHLA